MINGFKDLEGNVAGSNLPVCQYTLQRARQFTDSISFALAVHPFVSHSSQLVVEINQETNVSCALQLQAVVWRSCADMAGAAAALLLQKRPVLAFFGLNLR
jgi:hypothetical protein